jgi:hypothetical protein
MKLLKSQFMTASIWSEFISLRVGKCWLRIFTWSSFQGTTRLWRLLKGRNGMKIRIRPVECCLPISSEIPSQAQYGRSNMDVQMKKDLTAGSSSSSRQEMTGQHRDNLFLTGTPSTLTFPLLPNITTLT